MEEQIEDCCICDEEADVLEDDGRYYCKKHSDAYVTQQKARTQGFDWDLERAARFNEMVEETRNSVLSLK